MNYLHGLDIHLILLVNSFVGQVEIIDLAVINISEINSLKGGVVAPFLLYAWLVPDWRLSSTRAVFERSVIGILAAVSFARLFQRQLPYSLRPLQDPAIDFTLPAGIHPETLAGWSSFPSDHAVLFFAVATAVFFVNRQAGVFTFIWTTIVICLPRLYLGFHYLSDILGGAAIGILIMWAAFRVPLPTIIPELVRRWEDRHAASLFLIAFLFILQVSQLFGDARIIVALGYQAFIGSDL